MNLGSQMQLDWTTPKVRPGRIGPTSSVNTALLPRELFLKAHGRMLAKKNWAIEPNGCKLSQEFRHPIEVPQLDSNLVLRRAQ